MAQLRLSDQLSAVWSNWSWRAPSNSFHFQCVRCPFLSINADPVQQFKTIFRFSSWCRCSDSLCCNLSTRSSQMVLYCLLKDNFYLWDLLCLLTSISKPNFTVFSFLCGKSSPKHTVWRVSVLLDFLPNQPWILSLFLNMWECVTDSITLMWETFSSKWALLLNCALCFNLEPVFTIEKLPPESLPG